MTDYGVANPQSDEAVKLAIESQAAKELYHAASVAVGAAAVFEGGATVEQNKIDDVLLIIVRKRTANELLEALAVTLDLAPAPKGNRDNDEEVVQVIFTKPSAVELLQALIESLGGEPMQGVEKRKDVVETMISKSTAMDLLNAMVVTFGPPPSEKGKWTDAMNTCNS